MSKKKFKYRYLKIHLIKNCHNVKKIKIPNGIKDISDYFLGEAKDWCQYKYPDTTFETIKKFFIF